MLEDTSLEKDFVFAKEFLSFQDTPNLLSLTQEKSVNPIRIAIPNVEYDGFHIGDQYIGVLGLYDTFHLQGHFSISDLDPNVFLFGDSDIALNTFDLSNQFSLQPLVGLNVSSKLVLDGSSNPDLFALNPEFGIVLKRDAYSLQHSPGFSLFRLTTGVGPMLESSEDANNAVPSVAVTGHLQIGL